MSIPSTIFQRNHLKQQPSMLMFWQVESVWSIKPSSSVEKKLFLNCFNPSRFAFVWNRWQPLTTADYSSEPSSLCRIHKSSIYGCDEYSSLPAWNTYYLALSLKNDIFFLFFFSFLNTFLLNMPYLPDREAWYSPINIQMMQILCPFV